MFLAEDKVCIAKEVCAPNYIRIGGGYDVKQGLVGLKKVLQEKRKQLKTEQNSPHPDQKLIARLNVIISSLENTLSKAALVNKTTAHVR